MAPVPNGPRPGGWGHMQTKPCIKKRKSSCRWASFSHYTNSWVSSIHGSCRDKHTSCHSDTDNMPVQTQTAQACGSSWCRARSGLSYWGTWGEIAVTLPRCYNFPLYSKYLWNVKLFTQTADQPNKPQIVTPNMTNNLSCQPLFSTCSLCSKQNNWATVRTGKASFSSQTQRCTVEDRWEV